MPIYYAIPSDPKPTPAPKHNWDNVKGHVINKTTNTVEWSISVAVLAAKAKLSDNEIRRIQKAYGRSTPNWQRVAAVKEGMAEGLSISQIAQRHRNKHGFGQRMIEADHATLSKIGEAHKNYRKNRIAVTSF
jgi:hypothetical protein